MLSARQYEFDDDIVGDPDVRLAKTLGEGLMASERWRATSDLELDAGDLAEVFRTTPGLHKWAHYSAVYESVLGSLRHKAVRILEIGVARGGSLTAWTSYLGPSATVVGIDINPACRRFDDPAHQRHVRIGSQRDADFLASVVTEFGPFDVIIDDGSHLQSHVIASFLALFRMGLRDNGIYVVEDVHASYLSNYRDTNMSFVDLAKGLVDVMHAHYAEDNRLSAFLIGSPRYRPEISVPWLTKRLQSVQFLDSMIVIRKASGTSPMPAHFCT